MRDFLKSVTLTFAVVTLATIVFEVSEGRASSHTNPAKNNSANPAIDMIVTGSNKSSAKIVNPSADENECGLCYHRDIIKKRDDSNMLKPAQPYPGE